MESGILSILALFLSQSSNELPEEGYLKNSKNILSQVSFGLLARLWVALLYLNENAMSSSGRCVQFSTA